MESLEDVTKISRTDTTDKIDKMGTHSRAPSGVRRALFDAGRSRSVARNHKSVRVLAPQPWSGGGRVAHGLSSDRSRLSSNTSVVAMPGSSEMTPSLRAMSRKTKQVTDMARGHLVLGPAVLA